MAKKANQKRRYNEENPPGRPTKFQPEYCEMLINHLKRGKSYQTFAAVVDVCIDTLYEWERNFPMFSDAKKRGWAHYQLWWEDHGQDGMYNETFKDNDGMTVSKSINSTLWIYNMKCRFPKDWRDRVEVVEKSTITIDTSDEINKWAEEYKKSEAK